MWKRRKKSESRTNNGEAMQNINSNAAYDEPDRQNDEPQKNDEHEEKNNYENDSEALSEAEPENQHRTEQTPERENEFERFIARWASRDRQCDAFSFISQYAGEGDEDSQEASPFCVRLRESLKTSAGFAEGSGTDGATLSRAFGILLDALLQLTEGVITAETLAAVTKSLEFDFAVATARNEGELAGRNARIDEEFSKIRANSGDDGIPRLGGTPSGRNEKKGNTIFDVARNA